MKLKDETIEMIVKSITISVIVVSIIITLGLASYYGDFAICFGKQ